MGRKARCLRHVLLQRQPPSSLSEIDPDQLGRVLAFREQVKSVGLIRTFKAQGEFAKLLRIHLSDEIQAWLKRRDSSGRDLMAAPSFTPPMPEPKRSTEMVETAAIENEAEEEGYLDLIAPWTQEQILTALKSTDELVTSNEPTI